MDAVIDGRLAFSRDQIVPSSQAAKNFGELRRRARRQPQYISDRNCGIDTVLVDFDTFESLAVENEALREQLFYEAVARRLEEAGSNAACEPVSLEDAMGPERYRAMLSLDPDAVPDEDLFE